MKSAPAKKSARPKAAAASKARGRAAPAAAMNGPLMAAASLSAAVDAAFDEADTVVAANLLPAEAIAPAAEGVIAPTSQAPHELSDEAYVEQLLAAAEATSATDAVTECAAESDVAIAATAVDAAPAMVEEILCAEIAAVVSPTTPIDETPVSGAEAGAVMLPAQCLLRDTTQLKHSLLPHAAAAAPVSIDTRDVERIDTAAMQVLLAFVRDRHSQQRVVEWLGLNEVFVDSAQLLGIDKMLGLPVGEAAA